MFSILLKSSTPLQKTPFFFSSIPAGFPSPAADYTEDGLDFNELLVKRKAATYCLKVTGESMSGAGILPNDILVVDRSLHPEKGDIVVAALNGEFTVKRLFQKHGSIILHPENPDFSDIHVGPEEDFTVFGVVTSVVRQYKK
ncbi:MAG: translesion error-prone DNA polymerase V autoproteolytic subunit [Spirochaetia bacterium]|nr:translesion error-prone DNA polymerase V autoproteolytic subunit [Spirochaetia bacterium]